MMGVGLPPLLLSVMFPLCGMQRATTVPAPGIGDLSHLALPASPNKALTAPFGFTPPANLTTPDFSVPPGQLFALVKSVAMAMPRTYALDDHPAPLQAAYVARTPAVNFPDIIVIAVKPDGGGGTRLILYSHSIYGQSDFGTNLARLKTWLAAIEARTETHS